MILVGLLIYLFFARKKPPVTAPPEGEEAPSLGKLIPGAAERLIAITDEAVLGASVKSNSIVYIAWDGQINQIDFGGGDKTELGALASDRLGETVFSQNGAKLAVKQTLPSGQTRFIVFDTEKKTTKTLPQGTESVSFSPAGEETATAVFENGRSRVIIAGDEASSPKTVANVPIPDLVLDWHEPNFIALKTKPSGLAYGLLYTLDVKTRKVSRIMGNTNGLTAKFSPSGQKALYSQTSASGDGNQIKSLNLEKKTETRIDILSLPEKCAWSQDNRTVFCGAINTESDPVMPDDYYKRKIDAGDEDIVRVNLDTGQIQKVISGPFDAYSPFLSEDESYLFFINKIDGRLYRLTL